MFNGVFQAISKLLITAVGMMFLCAYDHVSIQ